MENLINLLSEKETAYMNIKHYDTGDIIASEGDECSSIAIVISGKIQIISYSFEGDEIIFNTISKNELFGNNLVFSDDNRYKGNVVAVEDSSIAFIHKNNLFEILKNNDNFLISYLKYQSNFGKKLNSTIKLLSIDSAEERFLYYLYQHNNHIFYKSISDLALEIHLKRETVSRLLSNLEKKHIIRRAFKEITLIKD